MEGKTLIDRSKLGVSCQKWYIKVYEKSFNTVIVEYHWSYKFLVYLNIIKEHKVNTLDCFCKRHKL